MEWRLGRGVVKGELDNRQKGTINGRIWLAGRDEPLELALSGNCLRDIAGHRIIFENRRHLPESNVDLAASQTGMAGEITASRKVKLASSADVETGSADSGKIGNCLYIEWYSDVNGRVVLEGFNFDVIICECAWTMSEEEEQRQIADNVAIAASWAETGRDAENSGEYVPMDEFEWEKNLKDSDALTDRFARAIEKYLDHPDCDRLIAREMGWGWLSDDEEDEDIGVNPVAAGMDEFEEDDDIKPNPLTEGVDWIRNSNGRITHPLTDKAYRFAMELWTCFREKGLIGEKGDPDAQDLVFQSQTLTAKLAGALDSLAYETDVDGGFVVACLKRTLQLINQQVSDVDRLSAREEFDPGMLDKFRKTMFEIRQEILRLMGEYRRRVY